MPSLDTNVLLRWLVRDDGDQTLIVQRLFAAAIGEQRPLYVPITVALELEWVLRSRYRFDQTSIVLAFEGLLDSRELELEDAAAIEEALDLVTRGAADFADCLHAGMSAAAGRDPMLTFDEVAARLPGVQLLER
jgi:predicted nucleic-acid-binding protein